MSDLRFFKRDVIATDCSGEEPNVCEHLEQKSVVSSCFTNRYVAKEKSLCRPMARLKPVFFAVLLGVVGVCMSLPFANAQPQSNDPFTLHYWLNPRGENFTLSAPTSDGNWIIAAPRNERFQDGSYNGQKNTIVVFKVTNADYTIIPNPTTDCLGDVSVIGMTTATGNDFRRDVEFEVHCVVESCNPERVYVLCGSLTMDGNPPVGMVAILDANLQLQSLREYPDVRIFYSVYAQDDYYFVCGQMQNNPTHRGTGIVLQDAIATPTPPANIRAFNTDVNSHPNWAFHKIAVRNQPCSFEFSVSGVGGTAVIPQIGWAVFDITAVGISFSNAAYAFTPTNMLNSRVSIANYPAYSPPSATQGVLLSTSDGNNIYTYAINDNQNGVVDGIFGMTWQGTLTDMDYGEDRVAWVGNGMGLLPPPQRTADYFSTHIPYPFYQGFAPPSTPCIYFIPFNQPPTAYYALHKLHFKDGIFHAGGYYQGIDDNGDYNRAAFAVTPEHVWGSNQCNQRGIVNFHSYTTTQQPTTVTLGRTRNIGGTDIHANTRVYRFCTMDCDRKRDDCGNERVR
jgi:hypothetical protein